MALDGLINGGYNVIGKEELRMGQDGNDQPTQPQQPGTPDTEGEE